MATELSCYIDKANISKQTEFKKTVIDYTSAVDSLTFQGMLMVFFNSLSTSFSLVSMSLASLIFTRPTKCKHIRINNSIF